MTRSMKLIKPIACLTAGVIFLIYWLSQEWSFEMDLINVMDIEICFFLSFSYFGKRLKNRSLK
jgi:hypothetical protein